MNELKIMVRPEYRRLNRQLYIHLFNRLRGRPGIAIDDARIADLDSFMNDQWEQSWPVNLADSSYFDIVTYKGIPIDVQIKTGAHNVVGIFPKLSQRTGFVIDGTYDWNRQKFVTNAHHGEPYIRYYEHSVKPKVSSCLSIDDFYQRLVKTGDNYVIKKDKYDKSNIDLQARAEKNLAYAKNGNMVTPEGNPIPMKTLAKAPTLP